MLWKVCPTYLNKRFFCDLLWSWNGVSMQRFLHNHPHPTNTLQIERFERTQTERERYEGMLQLSETLFTSHYPYRFSLVNVLHVFTMRIRSNHFVSVHWYNIFANNVDPDETSHLIWIYTVCHSDFNFRLKPLFASVDMSKFKDGGVHIRNTGMKG